MPRPALEVADILRNHGAAWRDANRGHVSLGQLKVMSVADDHRNTAASIASVGSLARTLENNVTLIVFGQLQRDDP